MADEQGYNGWTNYETWCVSLWIDNDYGMYQTVREMAAEVVEEITEPDYEWQDTHDTRVSHLNERLRNFIEETAEMTCPGCQEGASFVTDLLNAALGEVNWDEIAGNKIDEAEESLADA